MRIGIDSRLPYYQRGGISQYILHLVRALGRVDRINQYAILHSRKDAEDHLPDQVANFVRHDLWTPCHHRMERWTLGLELIPRRLDLLHSPDFIPPALGANRRVVTVHDLNFLHFPEFLTAESRRYYSDQIVWAVQTADHIIADSAATRRDIVHLLGIPEAKVTTIHLAANPIFALSYGESEIRSTLNHFDLESGFLLFVGTLSPRKNVDLLIDVFTRLVCEADYPGQLLLVGGRGWLSEDIFEAIAASAASHRIHHLGPVSDLQLAHLYRAADALALPSWYEGFGLPPLEAMHAGCPVVVSNRASLPEVVGSAAIQLEPDDDEAWFAALRDLLGERELRTELAAAGFKQARKFSWETTARKTLAVYQSVSE